VVPGLKGHFRPVTAPGAGGGKHPGRGLMCRGVVSGTVGCLPLFPCLAARRTTPGYAGIAFGLEIRLFNGAKYKRRSAIETFDGFVRQYHLDDLLS
jgi:hypothetical protein